MTSHAVPILHPGRQLAETAVVPSGVIISTAVAALQDRIQERAIDQAGSERTTGGFESLGHVLESRVAIPVQLSVPL